MKVSIGRYPKNPNKTRKVSVRIDPSDVWNMDHTLALIVLPMLMRVRDDKGGSPHVDDEDVPQHLRSSAAPQLSQEQIDTGWPDAYHHQRWEWVLDQMIWAFEQHANSNWEEQYYSGEVDMQINDQGYMIDGPNHTFKIDRDAMTKHQEAMRNGLRLFGKYYECLWT